MWLAKVSGGRGLYYIGGPDTLPQPLSREEEAAVIEALEGGGEEAEKARMVLIERNLRLVAFIARRYESPPTLGVNIEDLISIGTIGLIKSINTFRADKNIKLATYASRCIENEILMYIRKNNGQRHEVSIDVPLNTDWDGNELLLSDVLSSDEVDVVTEITEREERQTIRACVSRLGERERVIIELRYGLNGGDEMTQKEVADLLGISQSYISRLEKRILANLRDTLSGKL
jgi:RNA polymerase sporulation-specific sigma factor